MHFFYFFWTRKLSSTFLFLLSRHSTQPKVFFLKAPVDPWWSATFSWLKKLYPHLSLRPSIPLLQQKSFVAALSPPKKRGSLSRWLLPLKRTQFLFQSHFRIDEFSTELYQTRDLMLYLTTRSNTLRKTPPKPVESPRADFLVLSLVLLA